MKKPPVTVELSWGEAANLLVAASQVNTSGWTPAAKGNLRRAIEKLYIAIPMPDPNDVFLVVRGQTVVRVQPGTLPPVLTPPTKDQRDGGARFEAAQNEGIDY